VRLENEGLFSSVFGLWASTRCGRYWQAIELIERPSAGGGRAGSGAEFSNKVTGTDREMDVERTLLSACSLRLYNLWEWKRERDEGIENELVHRNLNGSERC